MWKSSAFVAGVYLVSAASAFAQESFYTQRSAFGSPMISGAGQASLTLSPRDGRLPHSIFRPRADEDQDSETRLYGVEWGERGSNDPCHVRAMFERLPSGTRRGSANFTECHSDGAKNEAREGSLRRVELPPHLFVTGVAVCTNDAGDKIKGVRLHSTYMQCIQDPDASIIVSVSDAYGQFNGQEYTLSTPNETVSVACSDNRAKPSRYNLTANCGRSDRNWQTPSRCAEGFIATELQVSTRPGGNGRTIVQGLGVICREVAPQ